MRSHAGASLGVTVCVLVVAGRHPAVTLTEDLLFFYTKLLIKLLFSLSLCNSPI